ncbi:coiled-coil domain-containing protein [Azotobacter salinestris]|uniref:hypothetical protein n=1 Tax=Azotobacter salinestris TaxID=69964 RepID=UPI001266E58C|nr:hypothetical protein [Azotobacter salinestris]
MKSLCITGSVQRNLDAFAANLGKAGAAAARPSIRDAEISIAAWHRKILAIQAAREADLAAPPPLGRVWEQLAGDIFLANYTQPLWYWAEADSVHVLDFWLDFDPNTFFLLLHTSPHQALLGAIKHGEATLETLQDTLDDWYTRTQLILRFHLRHPARSVLLDSCDTLGQTGACLEVLAQRWHLPLETSDIKPLRQAEDPLAYYLVDTFLQNQPQALALHNEVQASLLLIDDEPTSAALPALNDAVVDYLETRCLLLSGQAKNASLHQALEASQTQLAEAERLLHEQKICLAQTLAQAKQYQQELSATCDSLESSEQKNQLLLDQLHRTLSDLEKLALEDQRKTQQVASLSTEKAALQNQLDTLRQTLKASQAQLQQSQQDLSDTRGNLESSEEENQLLLAHLHQTQEDFERLVLEDQGKTRQLENLKAEKNALQNQLDVLIREKADLIAKRDALTQEKTAIATARDEQAKLASERKTQLDALAKEKADLLAKRHALTQEKTAIAAAHDEQAKLASERQTQLEEAESENELLLVQVHQTQEELEQYLLQSQAIQTQLDEQHRRLEKIQARYPNYWFDSLEASLLDSNDPQQAVQWRLTDVYLGKRLIPEIHFKTILVNGLANIIIQRTAGISSPAPLLRWPGAFASSEELPFIPSKGPAIQGSNAALSGLGPTDWNSLKILVKHLASLLVKPADSRLPKRLDTTALRNGLLVFEQILAKWPKVLRYDSIQSQEEALPGNAYGLSLKLRNLHFGDHQWPELDYSLATIHTAKKPFGQNIRLEFPESTRSALDNWFAESHDERGPRLELRFTQPDVMDTFVWNTLAQNDRQLIGALIGGLPLQIEELQHIHSCAIRPWQDWQALANSLREILANSAIAAARQLQGA